MTMLRLQLLQRSMGRPGYRLSCSGPNMSATHARLAMAAAARAERQLFISAPTCQSVPVASVASKDSLAIHARCNSWRLCSTSSSAAPVAVEGMDMLRRKVAEAEHRLADVLRVADLAGMKARLASMENDAASEDVWSDAAAGQMLLSQLGTLKQEVEELEQFQSAIADSHFAIELLEAGTAESSEEAAGMMQEALQGVEALESKLQRWELRRLLGGPHDESGAVLTVLAGAGGVDAMDFAEMLERMYLRWAAAKGFKATIIDRMPGDEAGIKSVDISVEGRFAYGYLKGEQGTHRLVRQSPFNAKGLRQTGFAGVEVMPLLDEDADVSLDIPERDIELSFMRCGGKGGQKVNKVETGVRMTHVPTGLSVKCTEHRTQERNRAGALRMLQAKLLVVLEEQRAAEVAQIKGDVVKAEWGRQIRNYVLFPYKLCKCLRSGHETTDVQAVLDGGLDEFIDANLREQAKQQQEQTT